MLHHRVGLLHYRVGLWPQLAALCIVNTNLYVTPGNTKVSLIPHTDFQCSLMVQLAGAKRWKLWVKPGTPGDAVCQCCDLYAAIRVEIALPTHSHMVRGRDHDDPVE